MAAVDNTGELLRIADDGLVKLDGITAFRKVERDGKLYLQFCDHDRLRIKCRGTRFVEIPLEVLVDKMSPVIEGEGKANEQ